MLRVERLSKEALLRRQVTGIVLGLSEVWQVTLTEYLLIFSSVD